MTKRAVLWGALCAMSVFGVSVEASAQQRVNIIERGVKDYHVVEKGDTLYDLSARYVGDVYDWPLLWSYNPHITNPHWIYPGDIVYLRPAPEEIVRPEDQGPKKITSRKMLPAEYHMSVGGFIEKKELPYVGRIVASPKQANMLGELDKVWVGFGDKAYTESEAESLSDSEKVSFKGVDDLKVGSRFAIVKKVSEIKDEEDEVLGHKYIVLGSLRVTEVKNKPYLHEAEITQSWREIERGALLVPYERQIKRVTPFKADRNLVAKIVDTVDPIQALGEFHYVFVNKGAKDGVRTGFRFFVYQRDEGLTPAYRELPKEIPFQRVGQVMIIDVRENYSTGLVVDSLKEMRVGDRLEMYEGT